MTSIQGGAGERDGVAMTKTRLVQKVGAAGYLFAAAIAMSALICHYRPARGQQTTPTPTHARQYVIACAVDELPAEVRKANETGFGVALASECMAVEAKVVCIVNAAEVEE